MTSIALFFRQRVSYSHYRPRFGFLFTLKGAEQDKKIHERCDVTLELLFKGSIYLAFARVALITIGTASPAIVGAYASGKGSLVVAIIMFAFALFTGVGTVFPALRKV